MFIKYIITITKGDTTDLFECKETSIAAYSARFRVCGCGKYFPEPTILNNCNIIINLLIAGTPRVQEDQIIAVGLANTELTYLSDKIKNPNTLDNIIINHSVNCAIEHIVT